MIQQFDKKFKKPETNEINKTFLNNKRKSKEEHENEKHVKLQKRKNVYKKLNLKTPKGQPVMKYKVQHLLHKIKDKISKGLI